MAMTGAPNSGRQLSKLSVGYPVPPWLLKGAKLIVMDTIVRQRSLA